MMILGIETSCDETSAGILQGMKVLANVTASQSRIHEKYGGVVPELAAREHIRRIYPVVEEALERAGIHPSQLRGVAYTRGPGLIGALMVGAMFARAFAIRWQLPVFAVNHLMGHLLSPLLARPDFSFPYLCLLASGGHTLLAIVWEPLRPEIVGNTRDDSAGEAFDKCAVMMGLSYPGGPAIDRLAQKGDATRYSFRMPEVDGLDFSFSGLKTAFRAVVLRLLRTGGQALLEQEKPHLAASIQYRIVEHMIERLVRAIERYRPRRIAIVGGVSANSYFRRRLEEIAGEYGLEYAVPPLAYCTDNGAMIALVGYFKWERNLVSSLQEEPRARLPLTEFV